MWTPWADERAALAFEDVASALDAGLPLTSLGGDPAAGERTLHAILQRRGVTLTTTEDTVLLHAWRAGRASAALRARARARTERATAQASLWSGVRYPLLLVGLVLVAALVLRSLVGNGLLFGLLAALAAGIASGFLLVRAIRTGSARLADLPLLGPLLLQFAELPYLETLGALYGAGVPLAEAHHAAVGSTPPGPTRQRLQIADGILQSGQPLQQALAQAVALHPESRSLVSSGEQAGQLEEALGRALQRRRDVAYRGLGNLIRWTGQLAYGVAVLAVAFLVIRFYTSYFAALKF